MMLQSFKENPAAVEMRLELGQGVHSVEVFFGGQKRLLIVDTGSADTAFPCMGCTQCGHQHANPFYTMGPTASYLSCADNTKRGFSACKSCGINDTCKFSEEYVEGSGWKASKVQDIAYFEDRPDLTANIVFGCMASESGAFLSQRADGIMGMSQDPDAVHVQFFADGVTTLRGFSQCIAADGGRMAIGGLDVSLNDPTDTMVFTPLRDTAYSYWTVSLETISVGGRPIDVDSSIYNAHRGCVFDSGTTFVYIPSAAKTAFQEQWAAAVGANSSLATYNDGGDYHLTPAQLASLPTISFRFANDATMHLPASQYMVKAFADVYTATIFFQDFAQATIIGASMLQNHNIMYDMDNSRIGIVRANCDGGSALTSVALVTALGGDSFTPEWNWAKLFVHLPSLTGFVLGVTALLAFTEVYAAGTAYWRSQKSNNKPMAEPLLSASPDMGGFSYGYDVELEGGFALQSA
ncbi:aspartyl protease family A01B [Achlya hypogyna]|uniref:Aspartyl protease family A01B n=1 Tax=Achlya hypogyna TaxID=1202772 RepID=A0A1V9Z5E0_ACHHY|nr:aspartyl protease family A01B [Achlya hypogyna]